MPGYEEEFDRVDFQVEELENVGNFKAWSRLSVIGCIRELQEPLPSERHTGQCYVDFFFKVVEAQEWRFVCQQVQQRCQIWWKTRRFFEKLQG